MKQSFCYIMTNRKLSTLDIKVTSDLLRRVYEHKNASAEAFTGKYGLNQLVWYEIHSDISEAIQRETQLKRWKRDWKMKLIEAMNPEWRDLYPVLQGEPVGVDACLRRYDGSLSAREDSSAQDGLKMQGDEPFGQRENGIAILFPGAMDSRFRGNDEAYNPCQSMAGIHGL